MGNPVGESKAVGADEESELENDITIDNEIDPIYKNVVKNCTTKNDNKAGPNDIPFQQFQKFDDRSKRITISRKTIR